MDTWTTPHGCTVTRLLGGRSACFLVSSGGRALMVDTSWKPARSALRERLHKLAVGARVSLAALVLTHAHFDHVGNAAWVKQTFGAKVIIHRLEGARLRAGDTGEVGSVLSGLRQLTALVSASARPLMRYEPVEADRLVDAPAPLGESGFELVTLLPTPGHTAGSLSVIVDGEVALVGDTMFGVVPGSVMVPFANDVPRLRESLRLLLDTGCRVFLPAHGFARERALLASAVGRKTE
jgi:glyoxylase-like metal-dependent hydrolase (beta-lactamase superfamily II)